MTYVPSPTEPLIIYHANCPDGWGSAWWLGKHLGDHQKFPGFYGDPAPDVTNREVYLVDFCYKSENLRQIIRQCKSLVILDHHKSAVHEVDLCTSMGLWLFREIGSLLSLDTGDVPRYVAVMDMDRSGVGLVSQYVRKRFKVTEPAWFRNIEDRDLWHFHEKRTQDVFAAVTSRRYNESDWDDMAKMGVAQLANEGRGVEMYRQRLIEMTIETAHRMPVGEHVVWCAAAPYAICSDVAGELAKREPELFGATYVVYEMGETVRLKFSLRSLEGGLDVSKIAASLDPNGGGHEHAAGFMISA